jgi:hypothetical protein
MFTILDIAYCLFQDIAQYIALHEERISKLPRPVFHYSKVGIIPYSNKVKPRTFSFQVQKQ